MAKHPLTPEESAAIRAMRPGKLRRYGEGLVASKNGCWVWFQDVEAYPDLLAALEDIASPEPGMRWADHSAHAITVAKAAIAKAKGQV